MEETRRGRVWLIVALLVVGALVVSIGPVIDLLLSRERTETFVVPQDATALDITARNGSVEVVVGDVLGVEARQRWALREPTPEVEVAGGVLRVHDGCPTGGLPFGSCQVSLRVTAPTELAATLRSTNGGIRFDGRGGEVDALTTNGRVAGDDLGATAVAARTTNGEVELRFSEVPSAVDARTVNGGVTVAVPDETYAVEATTTNGRVRIDVRQDDGSPRRIGAHSVNGPVTVTNP